MPEQNLIKAMRKPNFFASLESPCHYALLAGTGCFLTSFLLELVSTESIVGTSGFNMLSSETLL